MNRTAIAIALLATATAQANVPAILSFTGTLADAGGTPVADGSRNVTFRFFPSVLGGTPVWQNVHSVQTTSGVFTTLLGTNGVTIDPALLSADQLWVELEIDGDVLSPRMRMVSVPYAIAAASLDCEGCVGAAEVDTAEVQVRVGGACSSGQAVGAINRDGTVSCVSAGGSFLPGPGIAIAAGTVSTSFAGESCTPPDKLCGFDAAGDFLCCPDIAGDTSAGFFCNGTDKVRGWDAAGNAQCGPDDGGAGGGVASIVTGAGLTGGPFNSMNPMGTVSIAPGGVLTSMIAPSAVSQTVGSADLYPDCHDTLAADSCTFSSSPQWVTLFSRNVTEVGIYMFFVDLGGVTHDLMGGSNGFGLQLYNVTMDTVLDPADVFESWDYTFTTTASRSISRTFIYEKTAAGFEIIEVRGSASSGATVTIEGYSSIGGHNAGMQVIHLKK